MSASHRRTIKNPEAVAEANRNIVQFQGFLSLASQLKTKIKILTDRSKAQGVNWKGPYSPLGG